MFFKKEKKMIDIRELPKRGIVRIPKQDVMVPTNRDGFVEMGSSGNTTKKPNSQTSNTEFFGFMDSQTSPTSNRNESERITALDNKIYKLEQRIELLEKKLQVNQSSNSSVGVMGW